MSEHKRQGINISVQTERKYVGEVSRAILSTVLFNRLFGSLKPSTSDAVGVTYPVVNSPEVTEQLSLHQKEVSSKFLEIGRKSVNIVVKFYERRTRKNTWFQKSHKVCWETWHIEINLIENVHPEPELRRRSTAKELHRVLMEIITSVDSSKEHIPSITTTDLAPFPYEISVS